MYNILCDELGITDPYKRDSWMLIGIGFNLCIKGNIYMTIKYNTLKDLETLIENGTDVTVEDAYGRTVLHTVSIPSAVPLLVAEFLKRGKDDWLNKPDKFGKTPWHYAKKPRLMCAIAQYTMRLSYTESMNHVGLRLLLERRTF